MYFCFYLAMVEYLTLRFFRTLYACLLSRGYMCSRSFFTVIYFLHADIVLGASQNVEVSVNPKKLQNFDNVKHIATLKAPDGPWGRKTTHSMFVRE